MTSPLALLPTQTSFSLGHKEPITDSTPTGQLDKPIRENDLNIERWGNRLLNREQYRDGKAQTLYRFNPLGVQNAQFALHQTTLLSNNIQNPITFEGYNSDLLASANKVLATEPALVKGLGANLKVTAWNGDGTAHNLMQDYLSYTGPDHTTVTDFRPREITVGRDTNSSKWATQTYEIGADTVKRSLFRIQSNGADLFTVDKNDIKTFKPLTIGGDLTVNGNETVNGTLHVTGVSTLDGNVTAGGTLHVIGAGTFDSTLHVIGAATLDSTLTVTGAGTFSSTLHVVGNLQEDGTLTVNSTSHLLGNIQADGDITANGNGLIKSNLAIGDGTAASTRQLALNGPANQGKLLAFQNAGTNSWYVISPASQSYLSIQDTVNNRDQARFTPGASSTAALTELFSNLKLYGNIGFFGTTPVAIATVNGSRGGNVALQSLLSALSSYGLITDSTTA